MQTQHESKVRFSCRTRLTSTAHAKAQTKTMNISSSTVHVVISSQVSESGETAVCSGQGLNLLYMYYLLNPELHIWL